MKKLVLSLALVAGTSAAAMAQDSPRFGIKAGANYTKFSGDNLGNIGYKFGFVGGLAANFGFSESLSLQPELLYSMKGCELKDAPLADYNFKLNYLDLPIMFRYTLNDGQGPFVQAGPQLGYLINAKVSDGDGNEIEVEDDAFQKLELGYVAAIGYQTQAGLSVEARFNGGINSIGKDDDSFDQQRNRVFSLQLGYMFGGK
ncbi:MAG TPA: porin family protein [Hymenobacter sp.]